MKDGSFMVGRMFGRMSPQTRIFSHCFVITLFTLTHTPLSHNYVSLTTRPWLMLLHQPAGHEFTLL